MTHDWAQWPISIASYNANKPQKWITRIDASDVTSQQPLLPLCILPDFISVFFSKISFPTSPIFLIREGRQQPNYYAPVPRSETASLFFFFKTKIVCCFSLWKSSKGSQNKKQRVYAFCFLLMLFILFDQIRGSGAFYGSNCCYLLKPITDRPSLMPFGSSISSYTVQLMAKILTWQFDAFVFRYIFTIASYLIGVFIFATIVGKSLLSAVIGGSSF